jgi:mono/diheme cytochrome c family protein
MAMTTRPDRAARKRTTWTAAGATALLAVAALAGCASSAPEGSTAEALDATQYDECRDADGNLFGLMPADPSLTDAQRAGRCTWVNYTGGTEDLFRIVAVKTKGAIDAVKLVDSRKRGQRWPVLGALNDPGCTAATGPDPYGLWFDNCVDPRSTGLMGFRKIPNPKFDAAKWDLATYLADASVEPPYLVGTACGSCHVALNPVKPAADPNHPAWDNLVYAFGNQFINEAGYFIGPFDKSDFRYHVLATQERGTSDTSRQATDHINNPNVINSIINLADRPTHVELMNDGTLQAVPHILKDGADSIGIAGASLRVYLNEGMCVQEWLKHHDLLEGMTEQTPVSRQVLYDSCKAYRDTAARMPDAAAFLMTQKPLLLKDAPDGASYLTRDPAVARRGKLAFAHACASCHSSKQPPPWILLPGARRAWFESSVLASDFADHNFLSDDKRYPVTLLQTNAARALGTNAKWGHIWQDYSSVTFKTQPSPGFLALYNPYSPLLPIPFRVPDGGGYYRTPSIASIWATAPFLHNNELGKYNGDPSVAGRIDAFNDAVTKLLWPERRLHTIKRTSLDSVLTLPVGQINVRAGTPVNLLANIDPRPVQNQLGMVALGIFGPLGITPDNPLVATALLTSFSQSPDLIEDNGHYFGSELSDEDKLALIEFLKTL